MRRVVVTGLGVLSPIGIGLPAFREALFAGRCGIGPLTLVPTDRLSLRIAAQVPGFDAAAHIDARKLSLYDRVSAMAVVAAREAAVASGIDFAGGAGERTATVLGTGVGGITTLDEGFHRLYAEGASRLHPFTIPKLMVSAPTSHVSMDLGLTGPAFTTASACASAGHAIGMAAGLIRGGLADIAVTGGAEASLTVGALKGWEALRVASPDGCRPFSRDRNGLVLGEGAAVLVLEALEHAQARGAAILAELAGFGMSADAKDITAPDAAGAARAMRAALADARMAAEEVGYVNAHGTGTTANDATETTAIRSVFGVHADRLMVSSSKSMLGHALGAAGALEAAATVLALRHGTIPPTINFTGPDPACDLDVVPNEARRVPVAAAMSNSFAFGGLNAVLVFRTI
ncbi:beta-ketoacyl-[acyl-carrier-protein] synthase family protein [Azospirillum sp. RWY-5-1]|uniref:Nodulation protein E n=1 Tax=Azospirillum oleiclasticum TaxID=2735135 RepID=A0ABX2TD04_9PROT|nr:beta-ketoacyl-[acyl-carrier-protein] synthase family protein [Azospirillum oleiclasticum]NYZ20600.1 beta-ketoacyl-[acyl-carrier-protein] synthase family protein [Azospirillum oleiclasticum]